MPIQLLLLTNHLLPHLCGARVRRIQAGASRRWGGGQQGGGLNRAELVHQCIHAAGTGQRPALAQRELGDVGGVECETLFPHLALAVLGKANLLQPEARNRRVQQPEQAEVIVLAGAGRQLDDRCGLFEYLATAIEHEVVVGGDFTVSDAEFRSKLLTRYVPILKPRESALYLTLLEPLALGQADPERPEPVS